MKRSIAAVAVFLSLAARAEGLEDLAWMAGSWMERKGGVDTEEHWLAPRGGLMTAMNRTVIQGGPTSFEFLRIEMKEGKPVYLSMPMGRPATQFRAAEQGPARIVFEDPGRDFPRRISYWRDGEALIARIEGTIKGEPRAKEWRLERLK
jgi:hypothetical protein